MSLIPLIRPEKLRKLFTCITAPAGSISSRFLSRTAAIVLLLALITPLFFLKETRKASASPLPMNHAEAVPPISASPEAFQIQSSGFGAASWLTAGFEKATGIITQSLPLPVLTQPK
jgi:hypothetical protein